MQYCVFLVFEITKGAEIRRQFAFKCGQKFATVKCVRSDRNVVDADSQGRRPHPQANKTWSVLKQWSLETRVSIAKIEWRVGVNVYRSLCVHLVCHSSLHPPHLAQMDETEPHSLHITVWSWATVWRGLCRVAYHCPYFLNSPRAHNVSCKNPEGNRPLGRLGE
jgi:hypothetical protein